jgi:hypothetical protein
VKSPEWVYLTLLRKIEEEHNFLHQWKDKDGMKTRSYKQPPKRKQKKSFDNLEKLVNSIRASEHDAYQKFLDALPGVSLGLLLLSGEVPENLKQCPGDGVEQPQLLRICSHLINSLGKKNIGQSTVDLIQKIVGDNVEGQQLLQWLDSKWPLEYAKPKPLGRDDSDITATTETTESDMGDAGGGNASPPETGAPAQDEEDGEDGEDRHDEDHNNDESSMGDAVEGKILPQETTAPAQALDEDGEYGDDEDDNNNNNNDNDKHMSPSAPAQTTKKGDGHEDDEDGEAWGEITYENGEWIFFLPEFHCMDDHNNDESSMGDAVEVNILPQETTAPAQALDEDGEYGDDEDDNNNNNINHNNDDDDDKHMSPSAPAQTTKKGDGQEDDEDGEDYHNDYNDKPVLGVTTTTTPAQGKATAKKSARETPPTITMGTITYPTSEWNFCLTELHCRPISYVIGKDVSPNRDWAYYPCDCEKCMQPEQKKKFYLTFSSTTLGREMFHLYRLQDIHLRNVPYFPGSHPVITDNKAHNTNCGKFRKHRKEMNKELPLCCLTDGTESTLAFIAKHVLKWNDIGIEKVSDGTLGGKLAHHYQDRGLQFLRQLGQDWKRLPTKSEIGLQDALASLAGADFLVGELTKIIQQEEDIEPCRLLLEYPRWVIMWLQSAAKVIQYMYKLDSHLYEEEEITKILRSVAENWKKAVDEYREFEGELRQATTALPEGIQQGVSDFKEPGTNLPDADFYTLPPCYERHLFSNYNSGDAGNDGNSHLFRRIRQYSPGDDGKVQLFCTCRYCRDWDGKKKVTPIEIEIPKIAEQWQEANKTKACLVLLDERGLVSWQFPMITASLGVVKNVTTLLCRHCKRSKGVDTTGGDIPVCFAGAGSGSNKESCRAFVAGHLNMVKHKMQLAAEKTTLETSLAEVHKNWLVITQQPASSLLEWRIPMDSYSKLYIEDLRIRSKLKKIGHLLEKVDLKSIQELSKSMEQIMDPFQDNLQKIIQSLPEKSFFYNKN